MAKPVQNAQKNSEPAKKARVRREPPTDPKTPAEIYAYCMALEKKSGPLNKKEVAEHFEIGEPKLIAVIMDYCAEEGERPPKFASKGTSAPGTIRVRPQSPKADGPVAMLGPALIRALGIKSGAWYSLLSVEIDKAARTLTIGVSQEKTDYTPTVRKPKS